nr:tetratricopeptide repeat protein [Bacteroidales bacterium]
MRRLLLITFLIFSIINIKLLADDKLAKNNDLFKNSNNFSLNQIIDKLNTIDDTNKVNSYFDFLESQILLHNDLTFSAKLEFAQGYMNYLYSNNLQALKHFATSYKLFNSLKDTNGIVYSLYYQSIIANNINLNSIILNNFIEAKKYIPGFKNDSLLIEFYRLLGSAYFRMNLYSESINAVQSAIELAYRINSTEQLLRCYMNLALNFIEINKYKEAEDLLTDVLEKSKKLNNDNLIGLSYSYLGYLYNTLGQYEKCIEYNLKAIEYRKKAKDKSGLVAELNNIADSYYKLGKYTKALEYAKEAIGYADSLNNLDSKIATNLIIAETYAHLGNYKNAYETLQKSYNAYKDKYNQMFIQEAIDILVKSNYDYLINENMSLKQNIELNNKLLKNNKQLQFFLIISLLFALVVALLLYRNMRINRKYVREMAEMNAELININEKLK